MDSQAPPEYFLTNQTFLSLTDGAFIFMDLRQDSYVCLERRFTDAIGSLLGLHLGASTSDGRLGKSDPEIKSLLLGLMEKQLVTSVQDDGKHAVLLDQLPELKEVLGHTIASKPKITAIHLLHFFTAFIVSKLALKLFSIEKVVRRVALRKRKKGKLSIEAQPEDVSRAVQIHRALKPLVVSTKDQCLFNSLFLIEFLARFGIFPTWHFGVMLNEFSAHCWVQEDDLVYNDHVENVCQYQLIMKVQ